MEAGASGAQPGGAPCIATPPFGVFRFLGVWDVCHTVTWFWVCPWDLAPDGMMLNTPAVTAGIEVLETYFPGSQKKYVCKLVLWEYVLSLVEQGLASLAVM